VYKPNGTCVIVICIGAEAVKGLVPALVEKLDIEEDGNMKVSIIGVADTCSAVDCI